MFYNIANQFSHSYGSVALTFIQIEQCICNIMIIIIILYVIIQKKKIVI